MYWADAQMNYKDTIEKQVEYLQNKLREQDANASAVIGTGGIDVVYKGHDMKIEYDNMKVSEKITYFNALVANDEIIKIYITENGNIYLENDEEKVCLNDKYPEFKADKLKGIFMLENRVALITNKRIWSGEIESIQNILLAKMFDLSIVNNGEFQNNNIISFYEYILLDDGKVYFLTDPLVECDKGELVNIKFNDMGIMIYNNRNDWGIIDEQGKIYSWNNREEISSSYANGLFRDKKIQSCSYVGNFNSFITENGKLYLVNPETEQVTFMSEENDFLKNKKIKNIYYIGGSFNEKYYGIITEDEECYYTEDFTTFHDINIDGFPKLSVKKE